jgi:hypothetical protein
MAPVAISQAFDMKPSSKLLVDFIATSLATRTFSEVVHYRAPVRQRPVHSGGYRDLEIERTVKT